MRRKSVWSTSSYSGELSKDPQTGLGSLSHLITAHNPSKEILHLCSLKALLPYLRMGYVQE